MTTASRERTRRRAGDKSPAWLEDYDQRGYAVLESVFSASEVAELNAETLRLVRGDLGEIAGSRVTPDMSDSQALASTICVHFPHKRSELFARVLHHREIVDAMTAIIGPDVKAMQSMAFLKSEGKPGQAWHQDEQFIPTRDHSLTAAWIALDDATVRNGCLWAHPGSHRLGVLYPDREQEDEQFDCAREAFDFPYDDRAAVSLAVRAGDVVVFDGYLLHRSLPNYGGLGMRRALVNHYMSSTSPLPWVSQAGVPIAATDFRDIVPVAGVDYYAWRGTSDESVVEVRPDREGGCR